MVRRLNYGGLVIAGVGFFLTRFTVTPAVYEDPTRFYLAGIVPLALGLGLAAFGVALAVADVNPDSARMTAVWCLIGTGAMFVLVVLTLVGSAGVTDFTTVRSRAYLSNFLIGGSVGGTLIGVYAARHREQRSELRQQTHRLKVLNRLLRHEVLNAVTVIRGYASLTTADDPDAEAVIEEHADTIETTIEEVNYLTRSVGTGTVTGTVDLEEHLMASIDTVLESYPNADISLSVPSADFEVIATERIKLVFVHLLENAIIYASGDDPLVDVEVAATAQTARISVSDEGLGLPESQQQLLEAGKIEEFDNPGAGFGLNFVRFLVDSYGGDIETIVDGSGTTITVVLPLAEPQDIGFEQARSGLTGVRPATPHLIVILGAALVAGIPYGVMSEQLGGSVASIGVFYGVADPVVGWLTHEFHSVVFGFVFAALVSLGPGRYRNNVLFYIAVGLGWALVLWIGAAGVIAPLWLRLLGIPATIPTFSPVLLVSHLAWGSCLGALTALGYRYVSSRLARVGG
jgi:signal transduction histidine kinase